MDLVVFVEFVMGFCWFVVVGGWFLLGWWWLVEHCGGRKIWLFVCFFIYFLFFLNVAPNTVKYSGKGKKKFLKSFTSENILR